MPDDKLINEAQPPEPDHGDATPPHGDELVSERTFGRSDRYVNADDPDAERPVFPDTVRDVGEDADADPRHERFERIDDAAERDEQMAVRRRERKSE